MKKTVEILFKSVIAGIISIILLSIFSLIYYNPPVATQQSDLVTNFKFKENSNWSYMMEGFGFGTTDELGYNNAYYTDCSEPDIVFVGSSHLEALQVPQKDNCVYLLNEKFDKDNLPYNDFKCLNLGVSANAFEVSVSNFPYITDKYKDAKYIVIETYNVEFSSAMLDEIAEGKFHNPEVEKGLVHKIARSIPYIRLIYKKINEITTDEVYVVPDTKDIRKDDEINIYTEKMNDILYELSKKSAENDIKLVILLHQRFWVDVNRNIVTENSPEYIEAFKKCCDRNNIEVIDATKPMIESYRGNFDFSYGFFNTAPGEGHLNKTGHRIIAEKVYESINEMEENK